MQAYFEYKESNIPWLGKVPKHWRLLPCRAIVDNQIKKNEGAENQEYLSLMANIGVIRYEDKGDVGNKKPDDLAKCKIVKRGNLVINSMNYAIGSYGMSPYDGVCSPVYIVLEPNESLVERRFALRLFENKPMQKHLALLGNGILEHRAAIKWDDIKSQHVPVPPLEEQKAILDFLDQETARIDNLIAEKQTFINLLKEKRQALISHVVTKGLDPNVKMKDSGVEWIGEVPKRWAVGKIGFFARVVNGSTPSKLRADYWDSKDVPWLSSGSVNQYHVSEASDYITELALKECSVELLPAGSVIVGMIGQGKTRGMSALTKIEATINQNLAAVIPKSGITSEFLHYLFQAAYKALRDVGRGANQAALNCDLIAQFKIPVPPLDEQESLIGYLESELSTIDGLLSEVDTSIGYLNEHRTALISAAVTGKIDVRNYKEEAA